MSEFISESDTQLVIDRLCSSLDEKFLRSYYGRDELRKLETVHGGSLSLRQLVELTVRYEGAQLLGGRPDRIGRQTTSIRGKLLEGLDDASIASLFEQLRGDRLVGRREAMITELIKHKWTRGSPSAFAFTRALGLPDSIAGVRSQARDKSYELAPRVQVPPLKPFQAGVLAALQRCLHDNGKAVVSSFTGTGKTRMGMEHVARTLLGEQDSPTVIWIAQKRELLDQSCDSCDELWPERAGETGQTLQVFRYMDGATFSPSEISDRPTLVIATSQQVIARLQGPDPFLVEALRRACLLVIDEAHFALAQGHRAIIWAYEQARAGRSHRVVGLTATPGRSNLAHPDESRLLAELFGRQLIVPAVGSVALNAIVSELA